VYHPLAEIDSLQSGGCRFISFDGKDRCVDGVSLKPVAVALDVDRLGIIEQASFMPMM
jgi:hypothetical protein